MKRLFFANRGAFALGATTLLVTLTAVWLFAARWQLGGSEWPTVPNLRAWPFGAWLPPLGVLFIFGGLAAWLAHDRFARAKTPREQNASTTACLLAICLFALLWPWSLLGPTPGGGNGAANLIAVTWSDVSNGYFSTAYEIENARDFSQKYARNSQQFSSPAQAHVATHPPGAVLFYYAARRVYEASPQLQNAFRGLARGLTNEDEATLAAQSRDVVRISTGIAPVLPESAAGCALWCAFLLSLAVAATVPAVYFLARGDDSEGSNNEARGLLAAAFYALAPSVGLFAFGIDSLLACGAAWVLMLCAKRLRGGSVFSMLGAGALLALAGWISFGALAVGLVVVLALIFGGGFGARLVLDGALFLAGFVAASLLIVVIFPSEPLLIYRQAMAAHGAATLASRTYSHWVFLNFFLFALFAGWPVVVGALMNWRQQNVAFSFGMAALTTAMLLSLSGNVRGEVERLWMFLLPPICALAAAAILEKQAATHAGKVRLNNGVLFLALQAAQSLGMAAALAPLVRI